MKQVDKLSIVEDIEVEYKKLYNECKKKHIEVKNGIDAGLNTLAHLKTLTLSQLDIELKNTVDDLLAPIILASEKQVRKLYVSSLSIIKKLVSYGLITQKHSNEIIKVLKDILTNSSEEFVQIKVIETLLPMVDPNIIQLSENLVNNVMEMCLKFFSFKSNVFKNPLSALLKQLMNTVFGFLKDSLQPVVDKALAKNKEMSLVMLQNKIEEPQPEENKLKEINEVIEEEKEQPNDIESHVIDDTPPQEKEEHHTAQSNTTSTLIDLSEYEDTEVYKSAYSLFTTICDLCEGIKNPIISTSIYSKCLGYELLSSIISITNNLFTYLPSFLTRITTSLLNSLSKSFPSSYDYPTCSKLCRLTVQIITNLSVNYTLIPYMIKYSETTSINWQKQIGIESISAIFSCKHLLLDLFKSNEDIYTEIFNTITKISYASALNKKGVNDIEKGSSFESMLQNIIIDNVNILSDTETPPIATHPMIYVLIVNAYLSLKKSYKSMLEDSELKLTEKNVGELSSKQTIIKNIIQYKHDTLLSAMLALVQCTNDESVIDIFMDIFVDYVNIFGCLCVNEMRDKYLKEMNKLISNENKSNMILSEKAMKTVFRFFDESVNVIDRSGFICLIDALQIINAKVIQSDNNLGLNPNEEFELDVYIKYIENNLKKYKENNNDYHSIIIIPTPTDDVPVQEEKKEENVINTDKPIEEAKPKEEETPSSGGGLFSKIGRAFGFMRKTQTEVHPEINDNKIKETMQYLNKQLESIFILNSSKFTNDVIIDLVTALNDSSKTQCESMPSAYVANLHFNILKFIDLIIANSHRIHLIWELFINSSIDIASRMIKNVSHFSIDMITVSIMFMIHFLQRKEFNFEFTENFSYKDYQSKLISSLVSLSNKNISQDINLNIIYDINVLISNCSSLLNGEGWNGIFDIFKAQIKYFDEAQCENCFMLLEQIFEVSFDNLTLMNVSRIADILELFTSYPKNETISKHSLKLFVILCNLCEKFNEFVYVDTLEDNESYQKLNVYQKDFYKYYCNTLEERKKYYDDIWKKIFFKIINLSCDTRVNIRQLSIETFKQIFLLKNKLISPETALIILNEDFFKIFDKTNSVYEEKLKFNRKMHQVSQTGPIEDKPQQGDKKISFISGSKDSNTDIPFKFGEFQVDQLQLPQKKKAKFDNEKVSAPSQDELNWESTLQDIISALSSVISAYLQTNSNLGFDFYRDNIFSIIANKFSSIMKFTSPRIIIEILKCLKTISEAYPELYYKNVDMFWCIYSEMALFIESDYFIEIFPKMATESQMVTNIIKNLSEMYISKEALKLNKNIIVNKENFTNLIKVLKAMISSSYNNEGTISVDVPYKLLYDESNVFDFCYEIQKVIIDINETDAIIDYAKFLSSYIEIDLNNLHSEALCRKSLDMFVKLFTDERLSIDVVMKYLPVFISQTKTIICFRNNSEYVLALLRESKADLQLWHFASEMLIKILKYIITTNNKKKIDINLIWEKLIEAYEYIFKQSENGYKIMTSKRNQEELIKSCQEMEISIINFIVNGLLPNSLHIPREMQIKLLNLLDMGSNFDYSASGTSSSASAITSSISKVCISNLFELCKYKTDESLRREVVDFNPEEYIQIKVKIAKMCTPILIKRCKETLKKFLEDEIKSGSMPLSRSRLEDIKFVLEKLKNLNVYPNYNLIGEEEKKEPKEMMDFILMKKKSHLISLLPLLSEFITTKENEIKIIVKEIFRIISEEIGIK